MFSKFSIISLSLISNLISYSQAIIITEVTSIDKDIVYLKSDSSLFTGMTKEFYPNNSIKLAAHYKEGYKHGKFKRWHKNHRIYILDNYRNGYKHGVCKKLDVKGKKINKKKYFNGELMWEKDYVPVVPIESYY